MAPIDPQSRSWILTLPLAKYSRKDVEAGLAAYPYVGQLEQGEGTGYEHWQIYVENSSPVRFSTLQRAFPKGHFERRRGTKAQAFAYVTKEESRVPGEVPLSNRAEEIDLVDQQGYRSDLKEIHEALLKGVSPAQIRLEHAAAMRLSRGIDDVYEALQQQKAQQPRDITTAWIFGPPGSGKTRWIYDQHPIEDVCRITHYGRSPFDSYHGQRVLVLDEFVGDLEYSLLLNILDRWPLDLPARYRDRPALFDTVYIISNAAPWQIYQRAPGNGNLGALRRRLHLVQEMRPGGHLRTLSESVLDQYWGGFRIIFGPPRTSAS